jgi:BMFP domain-containing protein YqiC
MKQHGTAIMRPRLNRKRVKAVSDAIWETFDSLFKTVHRQGRRVEELEARILELERRLQERPAPQAQGPRQLEQLAELPAEKAA